MKGRGLIYVVGASGVGKDSVLAALRSQIQQEDMIVVAHRYITRPAHAGGENHLALSAAEFLQRERSGCFALSWASHALHYGIGIEIELWLKLGMQVLVNGSRAYAAQARARYPGACIVEITACESTLRQRLLARGREDAAAVEKRLARNRALAPCPADLRIANEGCVEDAARTLLDWMRRTV